MTEEQTGERGRFLQLGVLLILLAAAWRFCNFGLWLASFAGPQEISSEQREFMARPMGAILGLLLWVAWRATRGGETVAHALFRLLVGAVVGAVLGGAVGFDGFLAWSLVDDANLAPPIALFVTGPAGTVLGLLIGAAVAVGRSTVHRGRIRR